MIVQIADDEGPIEAPPGRDPWGLHARDEVWDGVYVVMPDPNLEHQVIVGRFVTVFGIAVDFAGLGSVFPGGNTSDRGRGWTRNYRIPDVSVVLRGSRSVDLGTHLLGGPDLAVEVLSEDDRAREKIPFYAANGVRELLVVDRDPWALELHRLDGGTLRLAATSTVEAPGSIRSEIVPLSFGLIAGDPRPVIEVLHDDGIQRWRI